MSSIIEILCLVGIFIGSWRLGKFIQDLKNSVDDLNERLTKLEKDAVKITFTGPPYTTDDVIVNIQKNVTKKSNPKQFDGVESKEPFLKTRKRKPKTVQDWEEEIDLGGHE